MGTSKISSNTDTAENAISKLQGSTFLHQGQQVETSGSTLKCMLTDRQNKYLTQIITLSEDKTMSSEKERIYLKRATNAINEGMKFQFAINDMDYNLIKK